MTLSRFLPILLTAMLAFSTAQAAERAVTVTGEATVSVPPDTAVIRIGVSSLEKTAREAGEANAKQMTAVLAAIKASGIAERDIQTSRLSLQPQYDPNKGGTRLTGFQANNQVTIRIRDIDSLPTVLDRAIAAGANEMSGIEFVVSEQSKLLDQARDEAIADARRKAELYAKAAGAKLGQVISISTDTASDVPAGTVTVLNAGGGGGGGSAGFCGGAGAADGDGAAAVDAEVAGDDGAGFVGAADFCGAGAWALSAAGAGDATSGGGDAGCGDAGGAPDDGGGAESACCCSFFEHATAKAAASVRASKDFMTSAPKSCEDGSRSHSGRDELSRYVVVSDTSSRVTHSRSCLHARKLARFWNVRALAPGTRPLTAPL